MEEKDIQVENKAFVNAAFGHPSMKDAAGDKKVFPRAGNNFGVGQHKAECALKDFYDFIFFMPVEGHFITGMVMIYMVEGDGEFFCAVHLFFVIV